MKNSIKFLSLLLMCAGNMYAQVGIGTTNPQQELHVSGSTSTIRVEGLSSSNNIENLGGSNLYGVSVTSQGDLTLGKESGTVLSVFDNMAVPVVVKTTASSGLNSGQLYSRSFTLTQRAFVSINYTMSMDFLDFTGLNAIQDGRAKVGHNYFYLGDGTTADTTRAYGMTSSVYSNANCDTATGIVYNTTSITIPLAPGTYSIHLYGAAYGGNITSDAAFGISFGERDSLDIYAMYH